MPLSQIEIKNFRSIQFCKLDLRRVNILLGENGTGKTNVLHAVKYFYDNLVSKAKSEDVFNYHNNLSNCIEITLTFDVEKLRLYSYANLKKGEDIRYKTYYEQITGCFQNREFSARMTKTKDGLVRWNCDISTRKMILNLFPLYLVDSREIDLINWDVLWKHMGDLLKMENQASAELKGKIQSVIEDTDENLNGRLLGMNHIFERRNVKVAPYTKNEFAAALAQIYFSGNGFNFEDNKLDAYSNGTNSFNFTFLLIHILNIISQTKMKEPVVVLDEPEISLHNRMIDSLTDIFYECSNDMCFLLASHSPRLVKNVLKQDGQNHVLYHVYQDWNQVTGLSRFRIFEESDKDNRERFFITDQHASAYFAKALLLVEGETELEVFQNPYLKILFPWLGSVEVVKSMSDDVVYRITSPKNRLCHIPSVALLDLDKIYTRYENLKHKYFKLCQKNEIYRFYKKGDKKETSSGTLAARHQRIKRMAEKCRFHYHYPFYTTDDDNYWEMIALIKSYFKQYGIFVARTTTEGMIITERTQNTFTVFLEEYFPVQYKNIQSSGLRSVLFYNRLTFLRLLVGGENDFGMTWKKIKEENKRIPPNIADCLNNNHIVKTVWVTKWLRFYFCRTAGIDYKHPWAFVRFGQWLESEENASRMKKKFLEDFPELGELLQMMLRML